MNRIAYSLPADRELAASFKTAIEHAATQPDPCPATSRALTLESIEHLSALLQRNSAVLACQNEATRGATLTVRAYITMAISALERLEGTPSPKVAAHVRKVREMRAGELIYERSRAPEFEIKPKQGRRAG